MKSDAYYFSSTSLKNYHGAVSFSLRRRKKIMVEVKTQDLTFLRINCISFGIFIKLYCTCIHKCI